MCGILKSDRSIRNRSINRKVRKVRKGQLTTKDTKSTKKRLTFRLRVLRAFVVNNLFHNFTSAVE